MVHLYYPDTKLISKKNRMKVTRGGRCYKPAAIKAFEKLVAYGATEAYDGSPSTKNLKMTLDVTFGDRRSRDLQNCYDCICDALEGIIYINDNQITELVGKKSYQKGVWEFRIIIEEIA